MARLKPKPAVALDPTLEAIFRLGGGTALLEDGEAFLLIRHQGKMTLRKIAMTSYNLSFSHSGDRLQFEGIPEDEQEILG